MVSFACSRAHSLRRCFADESLFDFFVGSADVPLSHSFALLPLLVEDFFAVGLGVIFFATLP